MEITHKTKVIYYIVQEGDTFSLIASRFLADPLRFDELVELNRDLLPNPHQLCAGQIIKIPRRANSGAV